MICLTMLMVAQCAVQPVVMDAQNEPVHTEQYDLIEMKNLHEVPMNSRQRRNHRLSRLRYQRRLSRWLRPAAILRRWFALSEERRS